MRSISFAGVCMLIGLASCNTYTMQVGDFNTTVLDTDLSATARSAQPWFSAVRSNYGYFTVQSQIDFDQGIGSLYEDLGCKTSPVPISSRQQTFSLVATHDFGSVGPIQVGSKQIPLFSFLRDDKQHTCQLTGTTIAFGPPALAADTWSSDASVRAVTADTVKSADLFGLVISLASAAAVAPATPVIGAAAQVVVKKALENFDSYVSNNLQSNMASSTSLLNLTTAGIRNGDLAWSGDLAVLKQNSLNGNSKIPVGKLVLTVYTRLSLFTQETRKTDQITDAALQARIASKWGLPFVPNLSHVDVWNTWVQPLDGATNVQLSQSIDRLPGMGQSDAVLPELQGLGDDATQKQVWKFCQKLRTRATELKFGLPDVLAIIATSLSTSAPWLDAKPIMHASTSGCFSADERDLLTAMGVEPGNDAVVAQVGG